MYLEDNDIVYFQADGTISLFSREANAQENRAWKTLEVELSQISKGEYGHFMLKEIFEQEKTVMDTMRGRIDFEKK